MTVRRVCFRAWCGCHHGRSQVLGYVVALVGVFAGPWSVAATAQDGEELRHEVIEVEVDAVAVGPEPFRWELLPRPHEVRSGNAAEAYREVFADPAFEVFTRNPLDDELRIRRMAVVQGVRSDIDADSAWPPLSDIAPPELTPQSLEANEPLRKFHEAAHYRFVDWGLEFHPEPLSPELPHLSNMRTGVSLVALQADRALREGRYDTATRCVRTMFGAAGHASPPAPVTLVESLVGVAIVQVTTSVLEAWVVQPQAPNLYLALSELPSAPVSLTPALRTERDFFFFRFPELAEPDQVPTDDQCIAMFDAFFGRLSPNLLEPMGPGAGGMTKAAFVRGHLFAAAYPHARYWLKENLCWTDQEVDALSPLQAVAVVARNEHVRNRDWVFRWSTLPLRMRWGFVGYDDAFWDEMETRPGGLIHYYDLILLPALSAAARVEAKQARKLARLTVIEALRHHVATHGGAFPASLDELELPAPNDPCTGRPFGYRVEDSAAILEDELLEALGDGPGANVRYVIRFREAGGDPEER
ncbi:MAG: hypothetical protein AAGA92_16290 [Planctomycetota bacterium]